MAAIEFAVLIVFLIVAAVVVTRLFAKHSKKNDPIIKMLDMIFYKKQNKTKQNKTKQH